MQDFIVATGLVKKFGKNTVVDRIDINIKQGEIFGFLGPNGAGKTTTIRMLTTLEHQTSGKILFNGFNLPSEADKIKQDIGIVQQQISLDRDISVRENIIYHAKLHKVSKKEIEERMNYLMDMIGLAPFLNHTIITLSEGWKRKVAIVCALMHNPKILFLDEPTVGLDVRSRHTLWKIIRSMCREGTTIILTTHYIEEAEALCDRVSIIDKGKIIKTGTPSELCNNIGQYAIEHEDGNYSRICKFFKTHEEMCECYETIKCEKKTTRKTTLEDVFLEITGKEISAEDLEP